MPHPIQLPPVNQLGHRNTSVETSQQVNTLENNENHRNLSQTNCPWRADESHGTTCHEDSNMAAKTYRTQSCPTEAPLDWQHLLGNTCLATPPPAAQPKATLTKLRAPPRTCCAPNAAPKQGRPSPNFGHRHTAPNAGPK